MSNKLTTIVAYHSSVDINHYKEKLIPHMSNFTDEMICINNDKYRSSKLQELSNKYGQYAGVVFDEFNSSSYFADEMSTETDYVQTCTYRRFLYLPHVKNLILHPNAIYAGLDIATFNHYNSNIVNYWFNLSGVIPYNQDMMENIFLIIIRNMFPKQDLDALMSNTYYCKEMYIMHKDVHKELVHKTYEFINMCCNMFPDYVLNSNRMVGFFIELFTSFFIASKEIEGYNVIARPIYNIERKTFETYI